MEIQEGCWVGVGRIRFNRVAQGGWEMDGAVTEE